MNCFERFKDIPKKFAKAVRNVFDPIRNASQRKFPESLPQTTETSKSLESPPLGWLAEANCEDADKIKKIRTLDGTVNDVRHWLISAKLNEIFEKHSWEEHGSKMHGLYKYLGSNLTNINVEIKNFHLYEKDRKYYIIHHIQPDTQPDSSLATKLEKYGIKAENKITPENFNSHIKNLVSNFDQITWGDLPKIHAIKTVEKVEGSRIKQKRVDAMGNVMKSVDGEEIQDDVPKPEVLITDHEGNIEAEMKSSENNGNNKVSSQKSGAHPLGNPGQKRLDESSSADLPQNIEKIHNKEWKSALPWAQTGIEWTSNKSDNDIRRQKEINEKYRNFRSKKRKDITDFTERQIVNKLRLCQKIFGKLYWSSSKKEREQMDVSYRKHQNGIKDTIKTYIEEKSDKKEKLQVLEGIVGTHRNELITEIQKKGDDLKGLVDNDFADYHLRNFSEKLKDQLTNCLGQQGYKKIEIEMKFPKNEQLKIFQGDGNNSPIHISCDGNGKPARKYFVDYPEDVLSDNAQWELPKMHVMQKDQEENKQLFLTNSVEECNQKKGDGWEEKSLLQQNFCGNLKQMTERVKNALSPAIEEECIPQPLVPPLDLLTGEPYTPASQPDSGSYPKNGVRFDEPTDQSAEVSLESLESRMKPFKYKDGANGAISTMLEFYGFTEITEVAEKCTKLVDSLNLKDPFTYPREEGVLKLHDENGQPTQLAKTLNNSMGNPFASFDSLIVYEKNSNPFIQEPVKHVLFGDGNGNSLSVYFDGKEYYRLRDDIEEDADRLSRVSLDKWGDSSDSSDNTHSLRNIMSYTRTLHQWATRFQSRFNLSEDWVKNGMTLLNINNFHEKLAEFNAKINNIFTDRPSLKEEILNGSAAIEDIVNDTNRLPYDASKIVQDSNMLEQANKALRHIHQLLRDGIPFQGVEPPQMINGRIRVRTSGNGMNCLIHALLKVAFPNLDMENAIVGEAVKVRQALEQVTSGEMLDLANEEGGLLLNFLADELKLLDRERGVVVYKLENGKIKDIEMGNIRPGKEPYVIFLKQNDHFEAMLKLEELPENERTEALNR